MPPRDLSFPDIVPHLCRQHVSRFPLCLYMPVQESNGFWQEKVLTPLTISNKVDKGQRVVQAEGIFPYNFRSPAGKTP